MRSTPLSGAVWFTSKTDKLVLDLEHMNLADPPACLCTHGKKAVWAALVQNKPEVIQLYKAWALFRHKAPKTPTAENPTSTTTTNV